MSGYLKDDIQEGVSGLQTWRAVIKETATALDQQVRVLLPDFDPLLLWGPCKWMPRVHRTVFNFGPPVGTEEVTQLLYPQIDDYALTIFDNVKELWIVAWWPAAYGGIYGYS